MTVVTREFEEVSVLAHFWHSPKQAAYWTRLPVALIGGVEQLYTACESTKEERATRPKRYGFDDWVYLGEGTLLRAGTWQGALSVKPLKKAKVRPHG